MSTPTAPAPGPGHNMPPVVVPTEPAMLADLQTRYPEIKKELDDMDAALKAFPAQIKDEATAKALADNLGKIGKLGRAWKANRLAEKKIWTTISNVIQNFFATGEEKLDAWDAEWRPRLKVYQDAKEAEETRKREEALETQRLENERLELERLDKLEDLLWAEARAELAAYDETKAREAAALEIQRRKDAEDRAELARIQERRLADEKAAHEKTERINNSAGLREIRRSMKEAERLHALAEEDAADDDQIAELDEMVKAGGTIGNLASPVAASLLLDEDQRMEIDGCRKRLGEMRNASNERFNKRERNRRAKLEEANRLAEEKAAAERAEDALWRDAERELAAWDRAQALKDAEAAKLAEQASRVAAGQHKETGRAAAGAARGAAREAREVDTALTKGENRETRMEKQLDDGTDAGRVRGNFSAVSSKTGRWTHTIFDEPKLRAVCGPLGEHFTEAALSGAVFQWMAAHRDGFEGERVEDQTLPGVVFMWEEGLAIKA